MMSRAVVGAAAQQVAQRPLYFISKIAAALACLVFASNHAQAVPIMPGAGPTTIVSETGVTQSFISNRISQMSNIMLDILDHERYLNEEGGPKSGNPAGSGNTAGAGNVALAPGSASQQSFAALTRPHARPMAFGPMKTAATGPRKIDAWVKGSLSQFEDDTVKVKLDGQTGMLIAGVHYNVSNTLLIGLVGAYDDGEWNSNPLATSLDGEGWLAGAYLRKALAGESALSLAATWGGSDNDIRISTINGSFETDRFLFIANYWNTWRKGPRRVSANAGLIYAEEDGNSYILSDGTTVGSQSAELGRLFFGPEFAYKFSDSRSSNIEPLVWIRGIWDFESDGRITVSNTASLDREEFYGQIGGGLHLSVTDTISVRLTLQYDGLGADNYSATTVQGRLNIPLN